MDDVGHVQFNPQGVPYTLSHDIWSRQTGREIPANSSIVAPLPTPHPPHLEGAVGIVLEDVGDVALDRPLPPNAPRRPARIPRYLRLLFLPNVKILETMVTAVCATAISSTADFFLISINHKLETAVQFKNLPGGNGGNGETLNLPMTRSAASHLPRPSISVSPCEVWGVRLGDLSFGVGVWGLGFGVLDLGFGVLDLGLGVSDFGFRVSGFGSRVSGFGVTRWGVQVSGFGFRVLGFGFRASANTHKLAGDAEALDVDFGRERVVSRPAQQARDVPVHLHPESSG